MSEVTQQPNPNPKPKQFGENTLDAVMLKVNALQESKSIIVPPNYSTENALRSAWLLIQQTNNMSGVPALTCCTPESIANALLDMVLQGLSPVKKQCYFIVMGNALMMQKSYFGQIAISKRVAGVIDAVGVPIYEGDVFKYTRDLRTGIVTVTQHDQEFDNINVNKLKGAYAIVTYEDGTVEYEIMTMVQIKASWMMGNAKGNSKAHINFPDQMACRTVINRALKIPVNSSSDADLFDDGDLSMKGKQAEGEMKLQISNNANKEAIGFGDDVQDAPAESISVPVQQANPSPAPTPEPANLGPKATQQEIFNNDNKNPWD